MNARRPLSAASSASPDGRGEGALGLIETTVATTWHLDGATVEIPAGEYMQTCEPGPFLSREIQIMWRGARRSVPILSVRPADEEAARRIAILAGTINADLEIVVDEDRPCWREIRAIYAVPECEDLFSVADYDDVYLKIGRRLGRQPTEIDVRRHVNEARAWLRRAS